MTEPTPIYTRAFPTELERTDDRTLTGRLMPYGIVTDIADPKPGGGWDLYREGFRPGAFSSQLNSPAPKALKGIGLRHRHDEGGLGFLGPFTSLREQSDGLYGDVRILDMHKTNVTDLLDAGIDELSVEFRLPHPQATQVDASGVRWRVRAHLIGVALDAKGAYPTAQVLAYRTEQDDLARLIAEQHEREEAEARQKAEAEAAEAAERKRVEAEAQLSADRRRRFQELSGRLDSKMTEQKQLVEQYGVTSPGGFRRS
jgi:HK97 family phage prohead protease